MTDRDAMRDQEVAEDLDDDRLADDFPPEEPLGVDEYGVTPRQVSVVEPLDERVAREVPDRPAPSESEQAEVGHLVETDQGMAVDDEPDAVAHVAPDGDERREVGDIASGDSTLRDTAAERTPELSAEEAAVHETGPPDLGDDVPPAGSGDGYIDPEAAAS